MSISTGALTSGCSLTRTWCDPIKTIGSHQVRVRLHPEVSAPVEIDIVAS